MDQVQRTSIKIKIHPKTQALLRKTFLALVQKKTQSALKTHMTIFIMNNHHEHTHLIDQQEQDMENKYIDQDEFHDKRMMTLSLTKNLTIFPQTLTTMFHI